MNTETHRVNVLAVMAGDGRAVALAIDESKSQHREQSWTLHLKDHDRAIDAVAELINAAREVANNLHDYTEADVRLLHALELIA